MTRTHHRLAHQLAHSARQLNEAISTIVATEDHHGPWHQQLEALRHTLLPTLTPAEFADMYAQTLVYNLFATRVIHQSPLCSAVSPVVKACVQKDDHIASLIDDCARLLEHTDMSEVLRDFGKATMQQDPVVHFYEDFLAAYAPRTREMRGVYYTPEPVVSYIVRSVDELLQIHFGKSMGLADNDTIILDPAMGTATFLHAVIHHIYATLQRMGLEDTWNQYVPDKLLPRLFGFELLMAPYTIAHLKLGMLLQQLGYSFRSNERLGIYLTNALSDTPSSQQAMRFAQCIADEGRAANAVKHDKPVMVVLGNPPYSANSANRGIWEQPIRTHYYPKDTMREQNPKLLLDDYVKFLRFGQWRIEMAGKGILAFITNHGYLDNPTFRGMRESLMHTFSTIYLLNLHGNIKKRETSPDGSKDENIFDIQQGVAIGMFVKDPKQQHPCEVYYADLWGIRESNKDEHNGHDGKYPWLLAHSVATTQWQKIVPQAPFFLFIPYDTVLLPQYERGWKITDVFPIHSSGIKTHRDHFVLDYERQILAQRITDFRDLNIPDATIQEQYNLKDTRDWNMHQRRKSLHTDQMWQQHFTQCLYRPFDIQDIYYHQDVIELPRTDVMRHIVQQENLFLIVSRQTKVGHEEWSMIFTGNGLADTNLFFQGGNQCCPLYLYPNGNEHPDLFVVHPSASLGHRNGRCPNLSAAFISDVEQRLGVAFIPDGMGDLDITVGPEDMFHYIYAVFHSPTYRTRYAEFLRIDFPRVPITNDKALFATLVAYGAELVDLHLLRLPGTSGVGGAGGAAMLLKPAEHGVTQHKATAAPIDNVTYDAQRQCVLLGNDTGCYVAGVDPDTWKMQIGGYQPLHKWLKDRKGRTLSFDDVLHYMRMVIALRETRRIMAEIGDFYGLLPPYGYDFACNQS